MIKTGVRTTVRDGLWSNYLPFVVQQSKSSKTTEGTQGDEVDSATLRRYAGLSASGFQAWGSAEI